MSLRIRLCDNCNSKITAVASELIKAATAGIHFNYAHMHRDRQADRQLGGALLVALSYECSDTAGFQSKDIAVLQLKKIHGHTQQ